MAKKKFVENIQFNHATNIDKENSIVRNVKVLGQVSLNHNGNRFYSEKAITDALPKYEGVKVYIDHSDSPRSYRDLFGSITNAHLQEEGEGRTAIYADLKFNPAHSVAEQLLYDAEHNPSNVGLSHAVMGKHVLKDGKQIIEEITKVYSVDLVVQPATTAGLFEQEEDKEEMEPSDLDGLKAAVAALLENPELDVAGLAKALCELAHPLMPAEEEKPEDKPEDKPEEKPAEEAPKEESVSELELLKNENIALKASIEAYKLKEQLAEKKARLKEHLDTLPNELVTVELTESLVGLNEQEAVKLIENLKAVVGYQKPVSKPWQVKEQLQVEDSKELAKRILNG